MLARVHFCKRRAVRGSAVAQPQGLLRGDDRPRVLHRFAVPRFFLIETQILAHGVTHLARVLYLGPGLASFQHRYVLAAVHLRYRRGRGGSSLAQPQRVRICDFRLQYQIRQLLAIISGVATGNLLQRCVLHFRCCFTVGREALGAIEALEQLDSCRHFGIVYAVNLTFVKVQRAQSFLQYAHGLAACTFAQRHAGGSGRVVAAAGFQGGLGSLAGRFLADGLLECLDCLNRPGVVNARGHAIEISQGNQVCLQFLDSFRAAEQIFPILGLYQQLGSHGHVLGHYITVQIAVLYLYPHALYAQYRKLCALGKLPQRRRVDGRRCTQPQGIRRHSRGLHVFSSEDDRVVVTELVAHDLRRGVNGFQRLLVRNTGEFASGCKLIHPDRCGEVFCVIAVQRAGIVSQRLQRFLQLHDRIAAQSLSQRRVCGCRSLRVLERGQRFRTRHTGSQFACGFLEGENRLISGRIVVARSAAAGEVAQRNQGFLQCEYVGVRDDVRSVLRHRGCLRGSLDDTGSYIAKHIAVRELALHMQPTTAATKYGDFYAGFEPSKGDIGARKNM